MKKIIPILTLLLFLTGCGKSSPKTTAEGYLNSLKDLNYEETKKYYANKNEFFVLKEFTDRITDGFRFVNSDKINEETMNEIIDSVKDYNEKCYGKTMDFDYKILDVKKEKDMATVKVKLEYIDGQDFPELADKIQKPDINSEDFSKEFVNYYKELGKTLDKYNKKKETIIVLSLKKIDGEYKIVNSSEIYNVLVEPLTKFIEVNQKWMEA